MAAEPPPHPVPILDLVDEKGEREREARTVGKEIEFLSAGHQCSWDTQRF